MRTLLFPKGKAPGRGGGGEGWRELIVLTCPLRAACQPACLLTAPPSDPSHLTKGLRLERRPSKLAAPRLPGVIALDPRVSEPRTAKEQVLGAEGAGGAGADGIVRQGLRGSHRGEEPFRAGSSLRQELLLCHLRSNAESVTSSPGNASHRWCEQRWRLFRDLSHLWPCCRCWEAGGEGKGAQAVPFPSHFTEEEGVRWRETWCTGPRAAASGVRRLGARAVRGVTPCFLACFLERGGHCPPLLIVIFLGPTPCLLSAGVCTHHPTGAAEGGLPSAPLHRQETEAQSS